MTLPCRVANAAPTSPRSAWPGRPTASIRRSPAKVKNQRKGPPQPPGRGRCPKGAGWPHRPAGHSLDLGPESSSGGAVSRPGAGGNSAAGGKEGDQGWPKASRGLDGSQRGAEPAPGASGRAPSSRRTLARWARRGCKGLAGRMPEASRAAGRSWAGRGLGTPPPAHRCLQEEAGWARCCIAARALSGHRGGRGASLRSWPAWGPGTTATGPGSGGGGPGWGGSLGPHLHPAMEATRALLHLQQMIRPGNGLRPCCPLSCQSTATAPHRSG